MKQIALCHTCQHQHAIDFDPLVGAGNAYSDWLVKHAGHAIEFRSPRRKQKDATRRLKHWSDYLHNADVKTSYAASAAVTISLNSLAASSTLLAGRESDAIDNGASNKYLDYLVSGSFTADNTNNQAGFIRVAAVGCLNDTPTWPDPFDGTDSAETVPDTGTYDAVCRMLAEIAGDNTASQVWSFGPTALSPCFGGWIPDQFVFFVSHSIQTSTNAWESSGHSMSTMGVYATVA